MAITVKQYSLLDYSISVTLKESVGRDSGVVINIPVGGVGKYLGSISIAKEVDNISKAVDATGAGVYSYTHNHSGTITIEISQLSDVVREILANIHAKYSGVSAGAPALYKEAILDITISKNTTQVLVATDCMLTKMPDLTLEAEAGTRTFEFLAMEIKEEAITY